jgi:catechol 2,3-dioxygenase-like lactoylglutathione lyase family enzyme
MEDARMAASPVAGVWPAHLVRIGALRFGRRSRNFDQSVAFYRDLVGLPVLETFRASYGTDGVIFGLPGTSTTLEIVRSEESVPIDAHDQLCLYFPNQGARDDARHRLLVAGVQPVPSHPYWEANGAVTYRDPDGREVVFAPFVYGHNEPIVTGLVGEHEFPSGQGR